MEEERDEVDGNESGCGSAGCSGKQHDQRSRPEELDRENAAVFGCEDFHALLHPKGDEEDARNDKQSDDSARVPGVERSAEINGENSSNIGPTDEDCAYIIELGETLPERYARAGVEARE